MLCLKPRCAELACFALKLIFKEKTGPDSRRKHCYAEQSGLTDTTANLIAQLRELERLRERIRKTELAWRSPQVDRRKRTRIRRLETRSRLRRR
jgi:hypothetical protein